MKALFWHWADPMDVLRETLGAGGVLAIPTESSYGLAVDPRSARGVRAIFEIKGRPAEKALPIVASGVDQLVDLGVPRDAPELAIADSFWPAPLTVLLPIGESLAATADLNSLAARVPTHPRLCDLLERLGHALTATSANRSGQPPVLDPSRLSALLGKHPAVIIDGGSLPGGRPSTLVNWQKGRLQVLRAGAFPVERLPRLISEA